MMLEDNTKDTDHEIRGPKKSERDREKDEVAAVMAHMGKVAESNAKTLPMIKETQEALAISFLEFSGHIQAAEEAVPKGDLALAKECIERALDEGEKLQALFDQILSAARSMYEIKDGSKFNGQILGAFDEKRISMLEDLIKESEEQSSVLNDQLIQLQRMKIALDNHQNK